LQLDALLFGRGRALARALGASTGPVLVCKAPLGSQCGVVLRSSAPSEQASWLDRLLTGMEQHAREHHLGIAFGNLIEEEPWLRSALRRRGYLQTHTLPIAQLEVEWSDFEGYLRFLRQSSKNAASSARRERNRNQGTGTLIRQIACTPADAEELHRFVAAHYRHKNGRDPVIGPQFLQQLQQRLGRDLLVFEAVRDGVRTAMLGVLRSDTVGWVAWIGVAQRERPNDFTYANLAFYSLVEAAHSLGIRTLLYGNSALQAKQRRGCRVLASHLCYRPHSVTSRLLARPYMALHRSWYRRKFR
jgi:predicted N-acyltransferase